MAFQLDSRIPMSGSGMSMAPIVSMYQAGSQMREKRQLKNRNEKYRTKLAGLYQRTGGDKHKMAAGLAADPETVDKAGEMKKMAIEEDRQKAMAQKQMFQQRQKQMAIGGTIANKYVSQDPQKKVENFNSLRRTLKQYGIPEPENWGGKTEYDREVEGDLQVLAQSIPAQKQGTDYSAKLQYDEALQKIKSGAEPTAYQKAMMEQMGWRQELNKDKKRLDWAKYDQTGKKIGLQERDIVLKEGKAGRETETFERKKSKEELAKKGTIKDLEDYAKLSNELRNNQRLDKATGAWTYLPTMRGGPTADVEAQLKTLKAKSAISTLKRLKAESATGASGMGALSERELDVLIDAYSTLQTTQSPASMRKQLKVIEDATNNLIANMKDDGSFQYYKSPVKKSRTKTRAIKGGRRTEQDDLNAIFD